MANPIILSVKPLLKTITKEALKVLGKEVIFSELDAINMIRSAVDKTIANSVAKSLGITKNQLENITKGVNITETRKNAVTGKNFLYNVNRFVKDPYKTSTEYIKRELKREITKGISEFTEEPEQEKQLTPSYHALKLLEGKLQKINSKIQLSDKIWDNYMSVEIEDVYQALAYVEMDLYGDSSQNSGSTIFLDSTHKGYKKGMDENYFMEMIENMLLQGYHIEPINGIY